MPGGERQRGDRYREDGAGDADRRRGDGTQKGARTRSAAIIEQRTVEQPGGKEARGIDLDEQDGENDAEHGHRGGHEPEGFGNGDE